MEELKKTTKDLVSTDIDTRELDPLVDRLKLQGLTHKRRRFCLEYQGDAYAAAAAAGYASNYQEPSARKAALGRIVSGLMRNEQIRHNISLIQRQVEKWGLLSVVEAKSIITELARTSTNERVRMEACKLVLSYEGLLNEKIILEAHSSHTETRHYTFSGPESNFLKSRQQAHDSTIDLEPMQTYTLEDPFSL